MFIRNVHSAVIVQIDGPGPNEAPFFSADGAELALKMMVEGNLADPLSQLLHAAAQNKDAAVSSQDEILGGPKPPSGLTVHADAVAIVIDPAGGDGGQHIRSPVR